MQENKVIKQRLQNLRKLMQERDIDAYLVPTSDYHQSEYVGEYFKMREYLSGFTGSAGTLLVMKDSAGLWTDGRYFIQAAAQLEGTGVTLFKMNEPEVPNLIQFLKENLPMNGKLGVDGKVVNAKFIINLLTVLKKKKIKAAFAEDLGAMVWDNRPALSCGKIWILEEAYAGKSFAQKINDVRKKMRELNATVHILTSLDDIAWLFNLRGSDISCNPVFMAYACITPDEVTLYVQKEALSLIVETYLLANGVEIREYNSIYEEIKTIDNKSRVLLDTECVNFTLYNALPNTVKVVNRPNPEMKEKAIKNEIEQKNLKLAHIKDGAAVSKFIYWLKQQIGKEKITELSATKKLDSLRAEQENFVDLSFDTIAAYGANAAMCHYSATAESNAVLEEKGFFLVDSGGQYKEGTTDITRTIVLGALSDEQKLHFTLVLKGMIGLASAHFLHGCRGLSLDYLARGPLWAHNLDYNHGTGHGVGYLLNVHEGPNNIRFRVADGVNNAVIEPGMLTSDEPGLYLEGKYGIRTENLILCKEAEKNNYGQFLEFETVTLAPIDHEAIKVELLSKEELEWLNTYHERVYQTLKEYLTKEEKEWLFAVTRPLNV